MTFMDKLMLVLDVLVKIGTYLLLASVVCSLLFLMAVCIHAELDSRRKRRELNEAARRGRVVYSAAMAGCLAEPNGRTSPEFDYAVEVQFRAIWSQFAFDREGYERVLREYESH